MVGRIIGISSSRPPFRPFNDNSSFLLPKSTKFLLSLRIVDSTVPIDFDDLSFAATELFLSIFFSYKCLNNSSLKGKNILELGY